MNEPTKPLRAKTFEEWQKSREKHQQELAKKLPGNTVIAHMVDEKKEREKIETIDPVFDEIQSLVWNARDAVKEGEEFDTVINDLIKAIKTCSFECKQKMRPPEAEVCCC